MISKVRSNLKQSDILACAGKYTTAFLYLKEYYFHITNVKILLRDSVSFVD